MSGVLLDTHVLIWSLFDRPELTSSARRHIDPARPIYVSVVSIYEIDFKRARAGAPGWVYQLDFGSRTAK